MLIAGLVFKTYDIAMASLPLEMLRQLNAPFVLAEILVIAFAMRRGFTLAGTALRLDRGALIALALFAATFWVGGVFASEAAPFAILFNLTYAVHVIFAGAVVHLAGMMRAPGTAALGRIVVAVLLAFAVMIAIRFLTPPPGRSIESISWQFAIPGFISVRLFGALAAPWAAFMLYLALARGEHASYRPWIFAAIAITSAMLLWSGTRAAVMGLGIAALVALVLYRPRLRLRSLALTLASILAGGLAAVLLLPYGDTDFWLYVPNDFGGGADDLASGRLALWQASWNAFLGVPMFGAGPGATAWILPAGVKAHIQPHNIVLEFLLNWGILASAAAFYLIARAVVAVHRRARRVEAAVPYVLAADCLLAIGFVDGTFHFAQHLMMWMAMMGLAFAIPDDAMASHPD